jgi:hypothetical protein
VARQSVEGYHEKDPQAIARRINELLKRHPDLRVSSIAMSEAWPVDGDGWVNALVVFERGD